MKHTQKNLASEYAILTDTFQAGPLEGRAATQVEMDDKWAVVLQNLLHCAICYPVFLHREVDLTGTHMLGNINTTVSSVTLNKTANKIQEAISRYRPDSTVRLTG